MKFNFHHRLWLNLSLFLLIPLLIVSFSATAETIHSSEILSVKTKKKMLINKTYTVSVIVKNTGVITWTQDTQIALSATAKTRGLWKVSPVQLAPEDKIAPGETKEFKAKVRPRSRTGIFSLQFETTQNKISFGQKSKTLNIIVENRSNRVKFISQLLPNTMEAKNEYSVVVQFKNNGSSTWTHSKGYKLRLISDAKKWNINRVSMGRKDVVPPGGIATFRAKLKAPTKPGNYAIQWRMQKGKYFFGEPTPTQKVVVTKNRNNEKSEFIYQSLPGLNKSGKLFTVLSAGDIYPVSLSFKNNSRKPWRAGQVSLSSQHPKNNMTWSIDRIELNDNESIPHGGIKTFNFKIITPLSPGIYNFQWQMIEGFNDWIGERSEIVSITVN